MPQSQSCAEAWPVRRRSHPRLARTASVACSGRSQLHGQAPPTASSKRTWARSCHVTGCARWGVWCPWQVVLCCESPHIHLIGASKQRFARPTAHACRHVHALAGAGGRGVREPVQLGVHTSVSHRPGTGGGGALLRDPGDLSEGNGTQDTAAISNPSSCPFSLTSLWSKAASHPTASWSAKLEIKAPPRQK